MIELGYDIGGYTHQYLQQAQYMLSERIEITGDQISAAGIRVIWLKQHGANICVRKGNIYLHEGINTYTKKPVNNIEKYLGKKIARKIGTLTSRLKKFSPSFFGIRKCK